MILITKEGRDAVKERFPYVQVFRTCKKKSKRHRYYMVEDRKAMAYLRAFNKPDTPPYDWK